MRILLIAAAAAALVTGCASQSGYAARGPHSQTGYAETQLEQNRLRVSYNGDTRMSLETVETYLLYRAAEATLERGFDYFVVVAHGAEEDARFEQTGGFRPRFGTTYREVSSHNAAVDILMFNGAKPAHLANAFDARAVQSNLAGSIQRPDNR